MATRSILSRASRISSLLPTKDKLLGTEYALLKSTRLLLQKAYEEQLTSGEYDVVTTSINSSISFLNRHDFWEDMSRDNDISYYKVGKAKKGVDPVNGEEYAFEKQGKGFRFCVPRVLVSFSEKKQFGGMMLQQALTELKNAKEKVPASNALLGATVFMEDDLYGNAALESLENQLQQAAKESPDAFCVEGCDSDEKIQQLKEILLRNEKKMVRRSVPNSTGHMVLNDHETEIGFDIPSLVVREGKIDQMM